LVVVVMQGEEAPVFSSPPSENVLSHYNSPLKTIHNIQKKNEEQTEVPSTQEPSMENTEQMNGGTEGVEQLTSSFNNMDVRGGVSEMDVGQSTIISVEDDNQGSATIDVSEVKREKRRSTRNLSYIVHSTEDETHPSYVIPQKAPCISSCGTIPTDPQFCNKAYVPLGFVLSPVAPLLDPPNCLRRSAIVCTGCGAFVNFSSKSSLKQGGLWKCVFCNKNNANPNEYSDSNCLRYAEFNDCIVEYIDPSMQPDVLGEFKNTIDHVVVLDVTLPQSEMKIVCNGIKEMLRTLEPSSRLGLVALSNVLSIYELSLPGIASAEVFHGVESLDRKEVDAIVGRRNFFFPFLGECQENIELVLDTLVYCAPKIRHASNSQRALGAALEAALVLLGGSPVDTDPATKSTCGQVLTFLGGPGNFGVGGIPEEDEAQDISFFKEAAVKYYVQMASWANEINVCLNLFCLGLKQFYIKELQNLVLSNGGTILVLPEMDEESFTQNVVKAAHTVIGADGEFSIQCSHPISFRHIIGPAIAKSSPEQNNYPHIFRMGCVQSRSGYYIYYDVDDTVLDEYVYFQFVVKYRNFENQRVLRVMTYRIPTTNNYGNFLRSLDSYVTGTLIAKKITLFARKEDEGEAIEELDHNLKEILLGCSTKDGNLVDQLKGLPRLLYLLRRGPLMSPILQHPDDIDYIRCLFLNANLEDSIRLIDPPLYLANQNFARIPLEDLALQSNFVLLLDHHTNVYIWVGHNIDDKEEEIENCKEHLKVMLRHRFPYPSFMSFEEGESMARCLQSRLIPSHQDSYEQQKISFPLLQTISKDEYLHILSKFHRTDELSLNSYLAAIKDEMMK